MNVSEKLWVIWTIAFLGVAVVIYKRVWRVGLAIGIAFYAGAVIADELKDHIDRARPTPPDALVLLNGYAMPSSHASFTMAMVVALLTSVTWTSRRTFILTAAGLGSLAVVIGVAMIYLGAHWATDVLAGWALGAVIGAGVGAAFRPRTGQSQASPASPRQAR